MSSSLTRVLVEFIKFLLIVFQNFSTYMRIYTEYPFSLTISKCNKMQSPNLIFMEDANILQSKKETQLKFAFVRLPLLPCC